MFSLQRSGVVKALEGSRTEARECSCLRRPLLVPFGGEDYVLIVAIVVTDAQLKETEDMLWLMVPVCGQLVPLLWACGEREHRESRSGWGRKRHDDLSTPQVLPPVRAYFPLTPFGPGASQ